MFFLVTAAALGAFTLLLVSLLDMGVFSLWVNPPMSLVTLLYLAGVLFTAQRRRAAGRPAYFFSVLVIAYVITTGWLAAFVTTIVVLVVYKGDYTPQSLAAHGLPVSVHTQRLQVFLTLFELFTLGSIAGFGQRLSSQNDGAPDTWRRDTRRKKPTPMPLETTFDAPWDGTQARKPTPMHMEQVEWEPTRRIQISAPITRGDNYPPNTGFVNA